VGEVPRRNNIVKDELIKERNKDKYNSKHASIKKSKF